MDSQILVTAQLICKPRQSLEMQVTASYRLPGKEGKAVCQLSKEQSSGQVKDCWLPNHFATTTPSNPSDPVPGWLGKARSEHLAIGGFTVEPTTLVHLAPGAARLSHGSVSSCAQSCFLFFFSLPPQVFISNKYVAL